MIVQDVRGRFASDGDWYPFKHEASDGYDAVEWAAALPYSNAKVGMIGDSYVGATQLLAAIAQPPHLAGIMPGITASNYHDGWTYQGGAFLQWLERIVDFRIDGGHTQPRPARNIKYKQVDLAVTFPGLSILRSTSPSRASPRTSSTGFAIPASMITGGSGPLRNTTPKSGCRHITSAARMTSFKVVPCATTSA